MLKPKYPQVRVQLVGQDGNVFNIIGLVSRALRKEVGFEAADEFFMKALNQRSYDDVLRLAMRTVEVY